MIMGKPEVHIVEMSDVTIGYGTGKPLLSGIRLNVNRGEMVALMGRNGSGKSTLLRSMIGLQPLITGSCILEKASLGSYSPRQRARMVSFVSSQMNQLPSITVAELAALGRMPHTGWMGRLGERDRRMVRKALEEVGLLPHVDRKLEHLSDGERQRALIARAFVQDTPLMVLDEPTAFLDIPNKFELIRLLRSFRDQGKSIVYSTHDMETALASADKIWMIQREKVLEGAPEDLGLAGIYHRLFERSGIIFEEEGRRFRYEQQPVGRIRMTGENGSLLNWTRVALERIGFAVDPEAETGLETLSTPGGPTWKVMLEGDELVFHSIYELARFLTKGN